MEFWCQNFFVFTEDRSRDLMIKNVPLLFMWKDADFFNVELKIMYYFLNWSYELIKRIDQIEDCWKFNLFFKLWNSLVTHIFTFYVLILTAKHKGSFKKLMGVAKNTSNVYFDNFYKPFLQWKKTKSMK